MVSDLGDGCVTCAPVGVGCGFLVLHGWLLLEVLRSEVRWPHLLQNYFPSQEGVTHSRFVQMMLIFTIAFISVLILKVGDLPCLTVGEGCASLMSPALLLFLFIGTSTAHAALLFTLKNNASEAV